MALINGFTVIQGSIVGKGMAEKTAGYAPAYCITVYQGKEVSKDLI
jgi:hypothetical protein